MCINKILINRHNNNNIISIYKRKSINITYIYNNCICTIVII